MDKRTDIWAFGCVLYEMLTGKRAFTGEDVTDTLGAVIHKDVDWSLLPPDLSPALATYIKRCLQKDPRQRIDSAHDMRLALEGAFETAGPPAVAAVDSPRAALWRRALPWVAAGIVLGGLLVSTANWARTPAATRPVARFEVTTSAAAPYVGSSQIGTGTQSLAVSPDGTRVVYRTRVEGRTHLYVRRLDQLAGTSLFSTDQDLFSPVVSPDGAWIAFVTTTDNTWKKVSMLGGPPVTLAPIGGVVIAGASWGPDDTIIVGEGPRGLWRVPAAGGEPTVLTTPDATQGELGYGWPEILPDGRAALFTIATGQGFDNWEIAVLDLATGEQKVLIPGGSHPRYAPSGHLIYGVNGTLMAVPFDRDRLELAGTAVPVVEDVLTNPLSGVVEFSLAADGSLVYATGSTSGETRSLVWVGRDGREEAINAPHRAYLAPRLSPDGTKVAVNARDQENDIWIWDLARDTLTRLTFDPGLDRHPVWSPDGRRIAFSSARDKSLGNLFWQAADGTGTVDRLAESDRQVFPTAFTPDGTRLLVYLAATPNDADIAVVQPGGDGRAVPLLATTFNERHGEVSPDGRWLAYQSNESGRDEVYVRPFPDVDTGRWQVSTSGGIEPLWARNGGRELFFRNGPALMAVAVQTGQTFAAGNPTVVFEGDYAAPGLGGRSYDVSPDGRSFLMIKEGAADDVASRAQIILVQNFDEELKRLVPTR